MTTPSESGDPSSGVRPSRPVEWSRTRCALNSCREEIFSDEVDAHNAEKHMPHDELVGYAQDYFLLRDVVINRFNPRDDDGSEVSVLMSWLEHVANILESMPCTCTTEMIEDYSPCSRCEALGRIGNEVEGR